MHPMITAPDNSRLRFSILSPHLTPHPGVYTFCTPQEGAVPIDASSIKHQLLVWI